MTTMEEVQASSEVEEFNLLGQFLGKNGEGAIAILKAAREEIFRLRRSAVEEATVKRLLEALDFKEVEYTIDLLVNRASYKIEGMKLQEGKVGVLISRDDAKEIEKLQGLLVGWGAVETMVQPDDYQQGRFVKIFRAANKLISNIVRPPASDLPPPASSPDIWEGLMKAADDVAERKGRDYTKGSSDRLANFKSSGADAGITPLQAWLVFTKKHVDAVYNYVKTGGQSESEPIMGRFVDVINYMRLGWLLVREDMANKRLGARLDYTMGAGRYLWVKGPDAGRKFTLRGRAAVSAVVEFDDGRDVGTGYGVSWIGQKLREGEIIPIDGTPELE